ncbi:hypothetical protein Dsin_000448 [Dipteronia sinensis]|uniref:Uncharacterized protein n=1 Tax=Dipteronia sinensis TaxID=43782 RepID=A0AAE0B391_9ROSI|nr:hypothetical protein Dsin_000448 [Dipteronia sinensis]
MLWVVEAEEEEEEEVAEGRRRSHRKHRRGTAVISARKLVAGLWRLQVSDNVAGGGRESLDRFVWVSEREERDFGLNSLIDDVLSL